MKRKFVLSIGIVLALSVAAVGFLQYFLFRAEQFRHIDQQIETTASLLIFSDLNTVELREFEEVEKLVDNVIDGEKLNQFVVIYNRKGTLVYRSKNSQYLPPDLALEPQWQTITYKGHFIRVLTVPLEKQANTAGPHRILQTGVILDADFVRWRSVGRNFLIYSLLIVLLVVITTWTLSRTLLKPLVQLTYYLKFLGNQFDQKKLVRGEETSFQLPPELANSNDEFGELVKTAQELHSQIQQGLRITQVWTAQMAHEMKTPLTILRNSLESYNLAKTPEDQNTCIKDALNEVSHLNKLISGFLEWSSTENFPISQSEVHAIKLAGCIEDIIKRISISFPDRIEYKLNSKTTVFAQPSFVEQSISNLIINALKYSAGTVEITLKEELLQIRDYGNSKGEGIPKHVLENLGQPFNYSKNEKGSDRDGFQHGFGLGLAWVNSICKKYHWNLKFENLNEQNPNMRGTLVSLNFPKDVEYSSD